MGLGISTQLLRCNHPCGILFASGILNASMVKQTSWHQGMDLTPPGYLAISAGLQGSTMPVYKVIAAEATSIHRNKMQDQLLQIFLASPGIAPTIRRSGAGPPKQSRLWALQRNRLG